jgi:hypothetical protein
MKLTHLLLIAAMLTVPERSFGAIGCTLSNPAQDLKALFPAMTTYKEELVEMPRLKNGAELFQGLKQRLRADLDPIYETYETPYTIYSVFQGQSKIGVVHGVNVPGKGGVIQVFLATDPATAEIRSLFFQRLESPAARQLRSKEFREQFRGMTLADFYKHDYYAAADPGAKADRLGAVKAPVGMEAAGNEDLAVSLRGAKKNLILLDFFVYGKKFEPFYERARQALEKKK